ncbi:transposase [Mesorhizobium sp. M0119]
MTAVTFVVEIGGVRRFDNPLQLMANLGLVPSESSTGERVKRGGQGAQHKGASGPRRGQPNRRDHLGYRDVPMICLGLDQDGDLNRATFSIDRHMPPG